MLLLSLLASNFRNCEQVKIDFNRKANLFFGENGAGKTNLLETIHYLLLARPFRGSEDQELIMFGRNHLFLRGVGEANKQKFEIEVGLSFAEKQVKFNDKKLSRFSELFHHFPLVSLAPQDTEIIQGAPLLRRRFLNTLLSQLSPLYFSELLAYRKILHHRNRLLSDFKDGKISSMESLPSWTEQLVSSGTNLLLERTRIMPILQKKVKTNFQEIFATKGEFILTYLPSFSFDYPERIKEIFSQEIQKKQSLEIKRGLTLIGPHRDDFLLKLNNQNLQIYGSQGEQRIAAIALKLAQAEILGEKKGEAPLILLDEVFAELDKEKSRNLLKSFKSLGQIFLTAAKEEEIPETKDFRIFYIKQGVVSENFLKL
ncbi:MAG: DNA replication/repair protein RecF [Candidatus Edwardsbacteria bacterium]